MANRIHKTFQAARKAGRKVLIPYIMAGDPDPSATAGLVRELETAGADIIELGIPFSDPIADGPVILRAAMRALTHDTSLADVIETVHRVRKDTDIPIVFMSYYNPIYKYGVAAFVKDAVAAGVDGVIVPDLPPEEGTELIAQAKKHGLATIFLLAPTSDPDRIARVCRISTGFIYYVSLTGITGAQLTDPGDVKKRIAEIRAHTNKPLAVGFGISTPEQARAMGELADGAIVGSALVKVIEAEEAGGTEAVTRAAADFVASLRAGLDRQ